MSRAKSENVLFICLIMTVGLLVLVCRGSMATIEEGWNQ